MLCVLVGGRFGAGDSGRVWRMTSYDLKFPSCRRGMNDVENWKQAERENVSESGTFCGDSFGSCC